MGVYNQLLGIIISEKNLEEVNNSTGEKYKIAGSSFVSKVCFPWDPIEHMVKVALKEKGYGGLIEAKKYSFLNIFPYLMVAVLSIIVIILFIFIVIRPMRKAR